MQKPAVLITSRVPDEVLNAIEPHAAVIQGDDEAKGMARDQVLARVGEVAGILNQNELKIDAELLGRAGKLKIVANATAGFDNMDISAMKDRGIWGTNCPDSYSADTATHTIGLLLALTRRIFEADRYVRSGRGKQDGWMPGGRWDGMSLVGKRLGLVGYGHIGQEVAKRARAFGMSVRHHTRSGVNEPGWLPLEPLLRESDVISLHAPLNDSTRHLINAKTLQVMKPGAILINVSRGPVVKNEDLIAALKSGHLAGAGLDVFEFEPDVPDELIAMQNVILSPHMGGCTVEARLSAFHLCAENIVRVLTGLPPKTPVFTI
jgi:glyoxylate reductase